MRSEEKRFAWMLALALAAVPLGLVGAMVALYFYGLSLVPETPRVAASTPPAEVVSAAIWARFDGGSPEVEVMTPWTFIQLRACRAMASRADDREAAREACIRRHPGVEVAGAVATTHVMGHGLRRSLRGEIGQVATAAWLTRHWSRDDLVIELAANGDFGHGWRGVEVAARAYFGRAPGALSASDAALLAAALGGATSVDPWCHPEAALAERNHVLERMALNGAVSSDVLGELRGQPLGVVSAECLAAPPSGVNRPAASGR